METKRRFRRVDHEAAETIELKLGDVLPSGHLARYLVELIKGLDVSKIYAKYAAVGGAPYEPELLLGLLLYGYATGKYSSRKIEKATYEEIPYIYIAGNLHPDHDTINEFRKQNLEEIKGLFVQVLLLAQAMGHLKLGDISVDGSKVHADASKSKAVSYGRLVQMEERLAAEIERLFKLAEETDETEGKIDVAYEIQLRRGKLVSLAEAKMILEERAAERYAQETAEYQAKLAARSEKEARTEQKIGGQKPKPPEAGPRAKDQYNFTAPRGHPDSRIMKNGNKKGFEQCYNGQAAVDHESRLIVGNTLSNHPNDQQEALPVVEAIPPELGSPNAAAFDNGYLSQANIEQLEAKGITPYIAAGRESHHADLDSLLSGELASPPDNASHIIKMIYALKRLHILATT